MAARGRLVRGAPVPPVRRDGHDRELASARQQQGAALGARVLDGHPQQRGRQPLEDDFPGDGLLGLHHGERVDAASSPCRWRRSYRAHAAPRGAATASSNCRDLPGAPQRRYASRASRA